MASNTDKVTWDGTGTVVYEWIDLRMLWIKLLNGENTNLQS